ncbi:hypothetical protein K9L67_01740 [Candidatus Woesearchaeota archaeon]|nr:hypothetical protein [Candidatus Woesearchaeota archaeon]MCF7900926.1 hypothetical protein [Candidatus Woesearchaeota archaeon]
MMMIDGVSSEWMQQSRKSEGFTAQNGYRRVTEKPVDFVKNTKFRKINDEDLEKIVGIVSDGKYGKMPETNLEINDLKFYLAEKYGSDIYK